MCEFGAPTLLPALIVIVAIGIVLVAGSAGTAAEFAAAIAALLAEWWIPIAVSLLTAIAIAYNNCVGGTAGVSGGGGSSVTIGLGVGATIASAIVVGRFKLRKLR